MKNIHLALAFAFAIASGAANALTINPDTSIGGVGPTASSGEISGNDTKKGVVVAELLDFINDMLGGDITSIAAGDVDKVNAPATTGDFTMIYHDDPSGNDSRRFSWQSETLFQFVVYKAGPEFVAHYFENGIYGNSVIADRGISHVSLLIALPDPYDETATVPIPASGLLLFAAVAGLVARRRWS